MARCGPVFRLKDSIFDGSEASAQIVASSDESALITVNFNASADQEGVKTTAVTTIEADAATIWTIGETTATGDTVSTSLRKSISLDADGVVITADAEAEAEGEGAIAFAGTDVGVGPSWIITAFEQESFKTNADNPAAVSPTYLAAERDASAELEAEIQLGSAGVTGGANLDLLV